MNKKAIKKFIYSLDYREFIDAVRSGKIEPDYVEIVNETGTEWIPNELTLHTLYRDAESFSCSKYGYVFYWYEDPDGNLYIASGLGSDETGGSTGYYKFSDSIVDFEERS